MRDTRVVLEEYFLKQQARDLASLVSLSHRERKALWEKQKAAKSTSSGATKMASDKDTVQLVDPAKLAARFAEDSNKERQAQNKLLESLLRPRELVIATDHHFENLKALSDSLPQHAAFFTALLEALKIQVATDQPLNLGRVLLCGGPGLGKSWLCHRVATCLQIPVLELQLSGQGDVLQLAGSTRQYANASPGALVRFLSQIDIGNPLILFEEVDKAAVNNQGNPLHLLLMLLERENAQHFKDQYLEVPVDLSYCSFFLTVNEVERLGEPLRSRLSEIEIVSPQNEEQWRSAVRTLYRALVQGTGLGQLFVLELDNDTCDRLAEKCANLRELRGRLERAIQAATTSHNSPQSLRQAQGCLVPVAAPPALDTPTPTRIGFY